LERFERFSRFYHFAQLIQNQAHRLVTLQSFDDLPLSADFLGHTAALASFTYSQSPKPFEDLLAKFGTHFAGQLKYGDYAVLLVSVDDHYFFKTNRNNLINLLAQLFEDSAYQVKDPNLDRDFLRAHPKVSFAQYSDLWINGAGHVVSIDYLIQNDTIADQVRPIFLGL